LGLRRAVRSPALAATAAAVLVDEPGRSLTRREIAEVLGTPVIARVPVRDTIARAVDAGVLASRLPDVLGRAAVLVTARSGAARRRHEWPRRADDRAATARAAPAAPRAPPRRRRAEARRPPAARPGARRRPGARPALVAVAPDPARARRGPAHAVGAGRPTGR